MSADLERHYARLLVAYPAGYRAEHQAEILATLLDSARPGQRHPSFREATALVLGGLRHLATHGVRRDLDHRQGVRLGVWDVIVPLAIAAVVAILLATGGARAKRRSAGDRS